MLEEDEARDASLGVAGKENRHLEIKLRRELGNPSITRSPPATRTFRSEVEDSRRGQRAIAVGLYVDGPENVYRNEHHCTDETVQSTIRRRVKGNSLL